MPIFVWFWLQCKSIWNGICLRAACLWFWSCCVCRRLWQQKKKYYNRTLSRRQPFHGTKNGKEEEKKKKEIKIGMETNLHRALCVTGRGFNGDIEPRKKIYTSSAKWLEKSDEKEIVNPHFVAIITAFAIAPFPVTYKSQCSPMCRCHRVSLFVYISSHFALTFRVLSSN